MPAAAATSATSARGEDRAGCAFRARCPIATERCARDRPLLLEVERGRQVACHRPGELDLAARSAGAAGQDNLWPSTA
jgi:hypothetical protein